jgi:hypothetical protein
MIALFSEIIIWLKDYIVDNAQESASMAKKAAG